MFRWICSFVAAMIVCFACSGADAQNVRVVNRGFGLLQRGRANVVVNNFGGVSPQGVAVQFVQPQFVPSQVFVGQSFGGFGSVRVQSFNGCRGF